MTPKVPKCWAMSKPHVSLRINCPLPLYEKIGAYRHEARHETCAQAMVTLLAAGLRALSKPVVLPPAPPNPAERKLIPFAGDDGFDSPKRRAS